jgi:hypothetical protein
MRRPRAGRGLTRPLITLCVVLGGVGGITASGASALNAMPTYSCEVGQGVTGQPLPRINWGRPRVSASSAARLGLYEVPFLSVLAPRGWNCSGGVGADGNADLEVREPDGPGRVELSLPSRGTNGTLYAVCALIPSVDRGLGGVPCFSTRPPSETVRAVGEGGLLFGYPGGVKGSAGRFADATLGALYWRPGRRSARDLNGGYAAVVSCSGPGAVQCQAVIGDFLRRYRTPPR